MFEFIRNYQLTRAIRGYIYQLGPSLVKRYGLRDQYTVPQISKTITYLRLSKRYLPYAVAMYRHEATKNTRALRLEQAFLELLRTEIADAFFDGNSDYRATQLITMGKSHRWSSNASPNWMSNRLGKTSL